MNDVLACLFLVSLSGGLALGARSKLLATHNQLTSFPLAQSSDGGICSLRVAVYGYACEEHTVTTEDGYILSMQRIPSGISGGIAGDRIPVLLQHGLLMDGVTWLLNSPDESLAFILADNGFDVWIANTRGTKYSSGHTSLSPDDEAYWQWSWDELVTYELPATVQYVHDQTGQKLHYVGHSLGTLVALAAFSQDKQVDVLRSAGLLSPIAYLGQVFSALAIAATKFDVAQKMYEAAYYEFDLQSSTVTKALDLVCKEPGINCFDLMTTFTGQNCCLNSSNTALFLENEPQPSATKNMVHISQMIRGGKVAMFDYGDGNIDGNNKHYGQPTPPVYDMTSIPNEFPLFLSYGGADALSDSKDVQLLLDSLKNHDQDKLVVQYHADYAHADFVMAVNANQLVYDPLVAFFNLH